MSVLHVMYLHGFASSPGGRKTTLLKEHLAAFENVNYLAPDLNQPDFTHLTLTAQLEHIAATVDALPAGPVVPVGSSFGGLAALHTLARYPQVVQRVPKLILLAPALNFLPRWRERLGADALKQWQSAGIMPFYHFAHNKELPLHYGLIEDITQYSDDDLKPTMPVLLFHGKRDESVDYRASIRFAERHTNVDLRLLDADHGLVEPMPHIMAEIIKFLDLA